MLNELCEQVSHFSISSPVKPFLKWVGGKTQIIDSVLDLFPRECNNYYEPFLGGGSVLLGVLTYINTGKIKLVGKIYAADINKPLIYLYKNIQNNLSTFIQEINALISDYSKCNTTVVIRNPSSYEESLTSKESYYYWIRKQYNLLQNEEKYTPKASAMLLFLNKTCFRGLYREGPNGFNVPYGNYKNPSIIDIDNLKNISKLIKDVVFIDASFVDSLKNVIYNDFIYIDPPYVPESDTSFVSYISDGFDKHKHEQLFNICHDFNKKNIKFLMSNSDVKYVRDSFPIPLYNVKTISCRRAINSKKPGARTNELLVTNRF